MKGEETKMCLLYEYNLEHRLKRNKVSKSHDRKIRRPYLLVLTLFLLILFLGARHFVNNVHPSEGTIIKTRVVEAGDTLWDIAQSSGLKKDTREIVLQIMKLNSLTNDTIQPGQIIYVPVASTKVANR